MEARTRFVLEHEQGLQTMTELCAIYGVSRQTGYEWLRRYREHGLEALCDLGRAPHRHPNQTSSEIEDMVLALREQRMSWGPRKLRRVLQREFPEQVWPAASTIGALLQRAGLVRERRKRRRVPPYTQPFAVANTSNRVWCADFKGWFHTRDHDRIDPLTITDAHSRYLLRCQAVEKTDTARVQAVFEAAFRDYGLPERIRSDNRAPFASRAIAGLSRLSVWWMKLGIVPERIEAGHPEQNGRHERMHRTLKEETATPPALNRRAQQRSFDRFRREYNLVRPHEALALQTPAAVYTPSAREFPARVPEPEYGISMLTRRVGHRGEFSWKHQDVFLTETLIGERVGLLAENDRFYIVHFAVFPIARFDSRKLQVLPLRERKDFDVDEAGEGDASPSPAPHPLNPDQKVSTMCPV